MAQADQSLDVARVDWNLGFVAAVEGDVPEALARYDRAEAHYAEEGLSVGRILLDRAAVLLQVGLLEEAGAVIARAVTDLEQAGAAADVAEGLVAAAQVALARGALPEAIAVSQQAERLTTRQDRPAWTLLARQVAFLAEVAALTPRQVRARGLPLATRLHEAGWREEEQEVLLLCAQSAIRAGDLSAASDLLTRASAVRHARANVLRHRLWFVRALLREARSQRSAALRAVISGLASLDGQRALLGATELRAEVAGQAAELATLGLRLASADGRPGRILHVAELSRAGGLRLRPVRPPRDTRLSAALTELRQTVAAELSGRMDDAPRAAGSSARVVEAEERVKRLSRGVPGLLGASAAPVVSVAELLKALGDHALAEYVVVDSELQLVTAVDGWVRRHVLGPLSAISVEVDTLRFALQHLTVAHIPRLARAFDAAADRLGQLLLGPAEELSGRELVVSPVAVLQGLPWACLPQLQGVPVSVTPSATLWCRAVSADRADAKGVVFATGPGLPSAGEEIRASALRWERPQVLAGGAATVAATTAALEGASIAHIAAHGRLRVDNPLFSSLDLADGPLTVYDLERLERAPATVLLPACRSAVSSLRSGEELLGLAAAFLALGSRSVVASVIPVPDATTAAFMPRLHGRLAAGEPVDDALAAAIEETASEVERATARSFVCLGSG
jgi:tetratricopeptide (TPR) repeat protein